MDDHPLLRTLADRTRRELTDHILPFWAEHALDARDGGFIGRIDPAGRPDPEAGKGGILGARILWTFAAATRVLGEAPAGGDRWRAMADRAYAALTQRFLDPVHGGIYWMIAPDGRPLGPSFDDRKHVYAQAFAVYALSEYHRATGHAEALEQAQTLYGLIERHGADPVHGGYYEAFSRDWQPLADARLSDKDADEAKSMNTHLHVLEAYATLLRVWPDAALAERLRALLQLFLDHIIDAERGHLRTFFDDDWTSKAALDSYGHDIEASWLILEAADGLAEAGFPDPGLRERVRAAAVALAATTRREGVDRDGSLFNERHADGSLDDDKHWWPQAEAVVGFLNAYEETDDAAFLAAAVRAWDYIEAHVIDRTHGEWFGVLRRDGTPTDKEDKVGPWKCPYHNARACLEVMARVGSLVEGPRASHAG